ncbi:MAG: iron-sulfur cluster assembly scaffold protein [Armatimonadetes bacterium]|nr:iron-sulfur cluster assembly scaffold protein [Armatimonadota bacterium]
MAGYSETVMEHFRRPRNVGRLEPCDLLGTAGTPGHGPFMQFSVRLEHGRVTEVRYQTFGCGPAIAAGSILTEMVCGRRLAETGTVSRDELLAALEGLPEDKWYCADLAVEAWRDLVAARGRQGVGTASR